MAMTNLPTVTIGFTLEDASGSPSKMEFHAPFATILADVIQGVDIITPLITAVTDCAILGRSITYSYYDPLHAAPVAGSRVEEKGRVVFRTANGRTSMMSIPAIKDTQLNASGSINRTSAAMAALLVAILDASAVFCSADGSDLVSVDKAYQVFKGSTRRELPSDK